MKIFYKKEGLILLVKIGNEIRKLFFSNQANDFVAFILPPFMSKTWGMLLIHNYGAHCFLSFLLLKQMAVVILSAFLSILYLPRILLQMEEMKQEMV